jgi:DNA invertase Pin-like site-specific DNA recombinase
VIKAKKIEKVGIYARVSTADQQTLPMQMQALKKYAKQRNWKVAIAIEETGSGAVNNRPQLNSKHRVAHQY